MRGKDHLKRELIMQERMKENAGEKYQTSAWEKAKQNNYNNHENSELKRNMTILQSMYQDKVKELHAYKTMYDENQRQLEELRDKVRWCEENHKKEVKSEDTEYLELGSKYLLIEKVKNEVESEDIKFDESGTHDVVEDQKENVKKEEQSESNTFLEFGIHDVLEEREKEENEGIKFVEFGTHDVSEDRKDKVMKEKKCEDLKFRRYAVFEERKEEVKKEENNEDFKFVKIETQLMLDELRGKVRRCETEHCGQEQLEKIRSFENVKCENIEYAELGTTEEWDWLRKRVIWCEKKHFIEID